MLTATWFLNPLTQKIGIVNAFTFSFRVNGWFFEPATTLNYVSCTSTVGELNSYKIFFIRTDEDVGFAVTGRSLRGPVGNFGSLRGWRKGPCVLLPKTRHPMGMFANMLCRHRYVSSSNSQHLYKRCRKDHTGMMQLFQIFLNSFRLYLRFILLKGLPGDVDFNGILEMTHQSTGPTWRCLLNLTLSSKRLLIYFQSWVVMCLCLCAVCLDRIITFEKSGWFSSRLSCYCIWKL